MRLTVWQGKLRLLGSFAQLLLLKKGHRKVFAGQTLDIPQKHVEVLSQAFNGCELPQTRKPLKKVVVASDDIFMSLRIIVKT